MTTQTAKTVSTRSNGHHSAHTRFDQVTDVVLRVGDSVPPLVSASIRFLDASMRAIERASDERIAAGTTLSLGLAIGLLITGAPRLLTAAALVPVAAMGLALLDRRSPRVARSGSPA
jgi:hypothetical protein